MSPAGKQITMDPTAAARRVARQQYAAVREALTLIEDRVVARYCREGAPLRAGFERFLGSLDDVAGWLLADDEVSRRGQDPSRRTGPGGAAPGAEAAPEAEREPAGADAWAVAADEPPAGPPAEPGTADTPASPPAEPGTADTVDVAFTLPAEVEAESVALCGEFNDWAVDDTLLQRGSDRVWRASVALEPGRSYRYRYLLDGERWENAWQADGYVPNSYGSVDSVVVVG